MTWSRSPGRGALLIRIAALCATVAIGGCSAAARSPDAETDRFATGYVQLAGALVEHDPDSASGDTAMSAKPVGSAHPTLKLPAIAVQAKMMADELRSLAPAADQARREWITRQLTAVAARASVQSGVKVDFADEVRLLFDIDPPEGMGPEVLAARDAVDTLLPGSGTAAARLTSFESRVTVPRDVLPSVFSRALDECRTRTKARVAMPPDEGVDVRFVTGVPWSAFSTYLGGGHSRIDVNTALPLTVDRVLELACHEGYPGHHVINTAREQRAAGGRRELVAVPLFSPESFAAESMASIAGSLVFTDEDRIAFERDVLFPLAGLPPADAVRHVQIARLLDRVSPAIAVHLSRYLSGARDFVETGWALQADALMEHPQATLLFANQFRGFALAYTWGRSHPGDMWSRYEALLKGETLEKGASERVWRATG